MNQTITARVARVYPASEMEGCILIDKRNAVDKNPALVFDAPMLGVKLADHETDRLADRLESPAARMVVEGVAEHNAMVGALVAKAAIDDRFIGLDRVPLGAYVDWWRAHGARIGCVKDGCVTWQA